MTTPAINSQPGNYVQANGINIYYEEYGSGEPLILIHGGSVTCKMWQPYIGPLAQHFRVITPDSRGHGRTNNSSNELSYRGMATDVAAFIDALGLSQPLVAGYSDGGQIALELGMRYPTLARALVVGGAWYEFSDIYFTWLRALGFEEPGVVNLEQTERAFPGLYKVWQSEHDPAYLPTMLKQISAMFWTPLNYTSAEFGQVSAPTLVVQGDRDDAIPIEQAVAMYRWIPQGELAIISNMSHGAALGSRSTALLSVMLDFLLRHSGDEALSKVAAILSPPLLAE